MQTLRDIQLLCAALLCMAYSGTSNAVEGSSAPDIKTMAIKGAAASGENGADWLASFIKNNSPLKTQGVKGDKFRFFGGDLPASDFIGFCSSSSCPAIDIYVHRRSSKCIVTVVPAILLVESGYKPTLIWELHAEDSNNYRFNTDIATFQFVKNDSMQDIGTVSLDSETKRSAPNLHQRTHRPLQYNFKMDWRPRGGSYTDCGDVDPYVVNM